MPVRQPTCSSGRPHLVAGRLHCGREEIRTPDPLTANQVLSQLSYAPVQGILIVSQTAMCVNFARELKGEKKVVHKQESGQGHRIVPDTGWG